MRSEEGFEMEPGMRELDSPGMSSKVQELISKSSKVMGGKPQVGWGEKKGLHEGKGWH